MFGAENSGQKLWLNEVMVTKSIAKKEYQKHNYDIGTKIRTMYNILPLTAPVSQIFLVFSL